MAAEATSGWGRCAATTSAWQWRWMNTQSCIEPTGHYMHELDLQSMQRTGPKKHSYLVTNYNAIVGSDGEDNLMSSCMFVP
jgi:hypothetical protein